MLVLDFTLVFTAAIHIEIQNTPGLVYSCSTSFINPTKFWLKFSFHLIYTSQSYCQLADQATHEHFG